MSSAILLISSYDSISQEEQECENRNPRNQILKYILENITYKILAATTEIHNILI